MPKSCCVFGCTANVAKNPEYKFYVIPKEKSRRERWLSFIGRAEVDEFGKVDHSIMWSPKSCHTYVCSQHFITGEKSSNQLDPDYVPSIFPKPKAKKPKLNPDLSSFSIAKKVKWNKQSHMKPDRVPRKRKKELTSHNLQIPSSNTVLSIGKDIELEWPDMIDLSLQLEQLQKAYTNLQADVDTLSAKNDRLKEDLHRVLPRFSFSSIKGDHEQILFFTGLHAVVFDWLVLQVSTKIEGVHPELRTHDHLLMILMKLKLGLCDTDLAYRFRIQESSVTRICQKWLPALSALLKPLIAWPSVGSVLRNRPNIFKSQFKKCRSIINFLEFVVATDGGNNRESTVNFFASVTPGGAVSFLSLGFSSFIPKRQIIQKSGFLHLVDRQDEILANSQIPIRDELAAIGSTLHVPDPNIEAQTEKSDSEEQSVHVWTHVEKVIGWWKEFYMLQKVIQKPYAELLDDIVIICAALTNVNLSLVPKDKCS